MLDVLAATQSLEPSPSTYSTGPTVHLGMILDSVWHGLWNGVTASPWTILAAAAFLVLVSVRMVHAVAHPSTSRDPIRRFDRADKAELLRRAGSRCEHHGWIGGRCKATEFLEADHVHPWSRGGWTHVSNGQILCKRHNREKRASIPFNWQLRGIAKRRAAYYPPGQPGTVIRRRPADRGRRATQH